MTSEEKKEFIESLTSRGIYLNFGLGECPSSVSFDKKDIPFSDEEFDKCKLIDIKTYCEVRGLKWEGQNYHYLGDKFFRIDSSDDKPKK